MATYPDAQIEVAHEALVRNWPRLVVWLDEEREILRQRFRLREAAAIWRQQERNPDVLWRGGQLAAAAGYSDLNEDEQAFVRAGCVAEEAEAQAQRQAELREVALVLEQKRVRQARLALAGLSLLLFLALSAIGWAWSERQNAQQSALMADTARQTAEAESTRAIAAEAVADGKAAQEAIARQAADASEQLAQQLFYKQSAKVAKDLQDTELDESLLISLSMGEVYSRTIDAEGSLLAGLTHDMGVLIHLWGQKQPVLDLAADPAGLLAAAGNLDGSIMLWDTQIQPMQPITLTTGPSAIVVKNVAWAQHKDVLGFGDETGQVGLWQLGPEPTFELFEQRHSFWSGYAYPVSAAAIGADDQLLATGSCARYDTGLNDCILSETAVWEIGGSNVRSPITPTAVLTGLHSLTEDVAFHPSRPLLAAAGCGVRGENGVCAQGQVLLWDVERLKAVDPPLNGHADRILTVAFSPDGAILASGGQDSTVILWRLDTLSGTTPISTVLPLQHTSGVYDLAYSADGSRLASSSCAVFAENRCSKGEIFIWDTATGELVDFMENHSAEISALTFHNQHLVSGGADSQVIVHDLAMRDTFVKRLAGRAAAQVNMVTFNPASTLLAAGRGNEIRIWDVVDIQAATSPLTGTGGTFLSVAFSPDGAILAAGDDTGHLYLWRWDTQAWTSLEPLPLVHEAGIAALAYQPRGQLLVSGSQDGSIVFWDTTTFTVTARRQAHGAFVTSLAFSPDGQTMLSGSGDGSMAVWDMQTQTVKERLSTGASGSVEDVAVSFDGQVLVLADRSGTTFLWDKASLANQSPQRLPIAGLTVPTWRIAFSPHSPLLAGGSADGKILLWDMEQKLPIGEPIQTPGFGAISDVAISLDGRWLASGDMSGSILLWPLDYDVWRKNACQIANRDLTQEEWRDYFVEALPKVALCPNQSESAPAAKATPILASPSETSSAAPSGMSVSFTATLTPSVTVTNTLVPSAPIPTSPASTSSAARIPSSVAILARKLKCSVIL